MPMFNMLKRMIDSKKFTNEYVNERIGVFYLVGDLKQEEYLELKNLISVEII